MGWKAGRKEGCCGYRGASASREQTQLRPPSTPPFPGAGGAGTWAGAIPRPKNNGRELGRGRGEAAPQRLPRWGVWADPPRGDN